MSPATKPITAKANTLESIHKPFEKHVHLFGALKVHYRITRL